MTTAKVYIVQDNPWAARNYLSATEFGELTPCISGHVSFASLKKWDNELREKLRGITKDDWLLPVGHPALIGVACAKMAERTGVIRLLIWDNQSAKYYPYETRA